MKKIKGLFKNNVKILLAFLVGILVSSGIVYAATVIGASEVSYTDNNNLGESTVQGAIDDLYTKANSGISLAQLNDLGYYMNSGHTVLANSEGVRIKRNGEIHFFKPSYWHDEKDHLQEVFSDISCNVTDWAVTCDASDFKCGEDSSGVVLCTDKILGGYCMVDIDGVINCT